MAGHVVVAAVAHARGAGGFEDKDLGADGGVRLVLRAAGDREGRALPEDARALAGRLPLADVQEERVAPACRLVERGEERLDMVAARGGLGTAANLRSRLRRETGVSPSAYRRRFGRGGGEAVSA